MSTRLPPFSPADSSPDCSSGVTRLAPSPTGALHLGNARTFLITWLLARQSGWAIRLRIEDIDSPRIKPGASQQLLDDFRWLGIDFDGEPLVQSHRLDLYRHAAQTLLEQHAAYPCVCTRSEIESAASAPHASDGSTVYPGTCRHLYSTVESARTATGRSPALRFYLPPEPFVFCDGFRGDVSISTSSIGDFPILKSDGTPAYQLACALDDALTGVTEVVRGDDLLDSVPRQVLLLRALGFESRTPRYTHLPLVLGPDGRRLAKRHGDSRLSHYRLADPDPHRVLTLLARWCGISPPTGRLRSASDLLGFFQLSRVPTEPIVATAEELQLSF
jgi:glutamyl-tRNA synthetase